MENLWQRYGGSVQFVAVNLQETQQDLQNWISTHGVTFPILHDPNWNITSLYASGTIYFPLIYIIGADRVVRKIFDQGHLFEESELEGHILDVVYTRDPFDIEMVMDVSGSMNSPSPSDPGGDSKLTMMKQATTMIMDFFGDHGQSDDRVGLIWFTDDVSEYQNALGQKLIPAQANLLDLKAQIDAHGTGMCTAMGAGLQTALDTLSSSSQDRFVILCTDGMQNIEPKVAEVGGHYEIVDSGGWLCDGHSSVPAHPGVNITTYNARIHTIGIGITATYATVLQEIANNTGGFYRGTNDPENDLDLIYFLDLANCMASGSPAVVHHSTGRLHSEECEASEYFDLNRSVRKISVMLSWKKSQASTLGFWLYAPDDHLLNLHYEMKLFERHALATIYLPRHQDGEELPYVGQWRMVIRGETMGGYADYHALVIAEDREIKYDLDFPRKIYEVGDILPIRVTLAEREKPIVRVNEILMVEAHLRVPLAELFAQYKMSSYALTEKANVCGSEHQKDPMLLKLDAMASDARFTERLKPMRNQLSLKGGSLECKTTEKEILIAVPLKAAGLHSFKVTVHCETSTSGPISRVNMVTVHVGPGKADPKKTSVSAMEISAKGLAGGLIHVTPRTENGQLLGPGFGHEIKAMVGKQSLEITVTDQLDGTYQAEILIPKQERAKAQGKRVPVNIMFEERSVWRGGL